MKELYPKELFNLFFTYAKKKAELLNIPLLESIKLYTPIYYLIGNYDWNIDEGSIYWNEYISNLQEGEDPIELAYYLHKKNYKDFSANQKWFGCFRYKYVIDKEGIPIIKLHFLNNDTSGKGPLSKSQTELRKKELRELFTDVKTNHPDVKYVQGGSWLYNIESYKRLFPNSYFKDMKSIKPKPNMLVIWGQFINSEWGIKEDMGRIFINKVKNANIIEDLDKSFELLELFPRGDITDFYSFYNV